MAKMGGGGGNSMGGRMGAGAGMSGTSPDRGRGNFDPIMQSPRPNFGGAGMPPQLMDMIFSMLPDSVRAKFSGTPTPDIPTPTPVVGQRPQTGPALGQTKSMIGSGQGDPYQALRALFGNRG